MQRQSRRNAHVHPAFARVLAAMSGETTAVHHPTLSANDASLAAPTFTEMELLAMDRAHAAAKTNGELDRQCEQRAIALDRAHGVGEAP